MDERRTKRVSEAVREELCEIVGFEMGDPRVVAVDITEVTISPDLRHAHVKVVLQGDQDQQKQALAALDHARHYLRHQLAERLNLRRVPELHFLADAWPDVEGRVERLLRRARKSQVQPENAS